MRDPNGAVPGGRELGFLRSRSPGPGVAEPRGRQDVDRLRGGSGVRDLDRHQQVRGIRLRVMHLDYPEPVVVEHTGVQELVLRVVLAASTVLGAQVVVREGVLGIVVAPPVPRMVRGGVEVPPVVLDVLTVVRLRTREAERPLLEERIAPVPQREAEAQALLAVAEPGQTVLAPSIGRGAGMVVRKIAPGLAVRAVVLTDRAPLTLAKVRTPERPVVGHARLLRLRRIWDPARTASTIVPRAAPAGQAPDPRGALLTLQAVVSDSGGRNPSGGFSSSLNARSAWRFSRRPRRSLSFAAPTDQTL